MLALRAQVIVITLLGVCIFCTYLLLTENVSMLTERLPMLTENVHLVPLQGKVTGTCLLMIIVGLIPQSDSQRRFAPSLSGKGR